MRFVGFILGCVSIMLMGCPSTSPVQIPIPAHESKLVLNGVLNDEEPIRVYVSRSVGVLTQLDTTANYVKGATVNVFENDEFMGEMIAEDSAYWASYGLDSFLVTQERYQSTLIPKPGNTYRIEVSHPEYDPVWAETVLPIASEIRNKRVKLNQIADQTGKFNSLLFFYIYSRDPAFISLEGDILLKDSLPFLNQRRFDMSFRTPLNSPRFISGRSIFWTNELNQHVQLFFSGEGITSQLPEFEKIFLNFTFSDSIYYAYRVAFEKHNQAAFFRPDFVFPVERTEIPSNVHGGYGMLGSYIRVRDSL